MHAHPSLEPHEKLFLYRKREGFSQQQLIDDIKDYNPGLTVNLQKVKNWEAGAELFDPVLVLRYQPFAISKSEWSIITRRRAGWTQEHVAESLGVELSLIKRMEGGTIPCDDLVKFWEQRAKKANDAKRRRKARKQEA